MLMLVGNVSESLNVEGFWSAFFGGLIISVVSTLTRGRASRD
jgi:uncharacterized membrane protein YvlD (DUF360 family)